MKLCRLVVVFSVGGAIATLTESSSVLAAFEALANNASAVEAALLDDRSASKRLGTCTKDKIVKRRPW